MKRKSIILIFIILIIVGGVFYWKKNFSSNSLNKEIVKEEPLTFDPPSELYTNSLYSFSFLYPKEFKVTSFEDELGELLVIQKEGGVGFQINIQPIDEDIAVLTVERIRQDLPDIKIEDPQDVVLGEAGKGVAFLSEDPAFDGATREVWFIYNKTLYQIRTYAKYDPLVKAILGTWKFE